MIDGKKERTQLDEPYENTTDLVRRPLLPTYRELTEEEIRRIGVMVGSPITQGYKWAAHAAVDRLFKEQHEAEYYDPLDDPIDVWIQDDILCQVLNKHDFFTMEDLAAITPLSRFLSIPQVSEGRLLVIKSAIQNCNKARNLKESYRSSATMSE